MGGRGSTRWNGYHKRLLVEECLAVDLVKVRRAGLLGDAGGCSVATWTTDPRVTAMGILRVGEANEAVCALELEIHLPWAEEPLTTQLRLVPFRPHLGGLRWFVECPKCGRRALKLYLPYGAAEVACRLCHGLVHRSAQQHDARLDLARRDPRVFLERRSAHRGPRSRLVTAKLTLGACLAMRAPRRGRGWRVKSMTSYTRAKDQPHAEAMQLLAKTRARSVIDADQLQ